MKPQHNEFAEQLIRARSGSAEALSSLLERHRGLLTWAAQQALKDDLKVKVSAADVVQETMLEAYRDFCDFQGQSDEQWQAWLRQALVNNLANLERRFRHSRKRSLRREKSMDDDSAVLRAAEVATQFDMEPDMEAIQNEDTASLNAALQALPAPYQQVLDLRYRQQLAFNEIAARMGRSANAARKLWARAMRALQQQFGRSE